MRFRVENHVLVENRTPLPEEQPFEVRLLPQAATQDEIVPWLIINHTQAASRAIPMDQAWYTDTVRTDGIESHLLADQTGRGMQTMPFNIVAHTSYKANRFYVTGVGYCGQLSVESQDDGGAGLASDPWTEPQFEFLCQAWAACCVAYGIPVQAVPSAYGRGVSQHNAFAEWSKSAHSCPGPARTAQMPAMRARIQQIIDDASRPVVIPPPAPPVITPSEEDDMIIVDYGKPGTDWWWTRCVIAGGTIAWVQGKAQQWTEPGTSAPRTLDELATKHIQVENDQHFTDLLATYKATSACPSTFAQNPDLTYAWAASLAR